MGRNLSRLFALDPNYQVFAPDKSAMDLLNPDQIKQALEWVEPDIIIHAAIIGGTVKDKDTLQDVPANVKMFDQLMAHVPERTRVFVIGSGADFDRSQDIDCACEEDLDNSYPTDPYGIAKNIITRKALHDYQNTYVVRLFGCFNHDEDPYRFIKSCIRSILEDKPILIHQDRLMDFFYMDDVYRVMNHLMVNGGLRHINLVYPDKYSLINIAEMVKQASGKKTHPIWLENLGMGKAYTGDWTKLHTMKLNLIGLEEGIVRTCKSLL